MAEYTANYMVTAMGGRPVDLTTFFVHPDNE